MLFQPVTVCMEPAAFHYLQGIGNKKSGHCFVSYLCCCFVLVLWRVSDHVYRPRVWCWLRGSVRLTDAGLAPPWGRDSEAAQHRPGCVPHTGPWTRAQAQARSHTQSLNSSQGRQGLTLGQLLQLPRHSRHLGVWPAPAS